MKIDINTLREIRDREKKSPYLQDVDKDFYKDLEDYLKGKYKEREKGGKNSEVKVILKEIDNIKTIIKDIYAARERKIVSNALYYVKSGEKIDLGQLTPKEENLLNQMIKILKDSRKDILESVTSREKEIEKTQPKKSKKEITMITIRMLKEAPSIVGIDGKTYGSFRVEDIITLPELNGRVFINQGIAEPIKIKR